MSKIQSPCPPWVCTCGYSTLSSSEQEALQYLRTSVTELQKMDDARFLEYIDKHEIVDQKNTAYLCRKQSAIIRNRMAHILGQDFLATSAPWIPNATEIHDDE